MTVLDQVKKMEQMGYNDGQIVQNLQDQGITPREINDAISQSRIKEAISSREESSQGIEGMQPSIINQSSQQQSQDQYMPQFPEPEQQYDQPIQPDIPQGQYAIEGNQNFYPDNSQQQGDYGAYYGMNTETMGEIASQIITEKLIKTHKVISDLSEFKIITEAKVDKIDQRLQRIESIIDQLQTSLIRKSSSHSQDVEDIKTELKGMQSSFSKVLNPLTESFREMQGNTKTQTTIKKTVSKNIKS